MSSSRDNDLSNAEESTTEVNPYMARYKFNVSANRMDNDYFETLDENFTAMLKKRGRLFMSTKLRNIKSSEHILQYFGRKLADDLKQKEIENLNGISYSAEFVPIECDKNSLNPLKIVVHSIDPKNKKKAKTIVFMGLFFSWQYVETINDDYYDLPFLFSVGPQKLLATINNLFEEYFGCKIKPAVLSQHEIRWLFILVLHQIMEGSLKSMHLMYQMQSDPMKMKLTFTSGDLKNIWTKIHDEEVSEITFKEVSTLHNAFEEHILESLRIDLSYFHLKRFSVSDLITIDVSGKLHISTGDLMDLVYRFLSER